MGLFSLQFPCLEVCHYARRETGKGVLTGCNTGLTYPALAILFSRTMDAFAAVDVAKGNFYSLMFFVVALANLVIYAAGGWVANSIGQVS